MKSFTQNRAYRFKVYSRTFSIGYGYFGVAAHDEVAARQRLAGMLARAGIKAEKPIKSVKVLA
jgi:hypothetical protein